MEKFGLLIFVFTYSAAYIINDLHDLEYDKKHKLRVIVEVSYFEDRNQTFDLNIYVEQADYKDDIIKSFEEALKDICKGLLPLGGMTTKGHGMFTGKLFKNKELGYLNIMVIFEVFFPVENN